MIVDTSAIVAIWEREPGWERLARTLASDERPQMSAATLVELRAVMRDRLAPENERRLGALLSAYAIEIAPFTESQAVLAGDAYRDFGKGSGHHARLNLGDCFAYALAAETGEPLLFVGSDFNWTDVTPALRPGAEAQDSAPPDLADAVPPLALSESEPDT